MAKKSASMAAPGGCIGAAVNRRDFLGPTVARGFYQVVALARGEGAEPRVIREAMQSYSQALGVARRAAGNGMWVVGADAMARARSYAARHGARVSACYVGIHGESYVLVPREEP